MPSLFAAVCFLDVVGSVEDGPSTAGWHEKSFSFGVVCFEHVVVLVEFWPSTVRRHEKLFYLLLFILYMYVRRWKRAVCCWKWTRQSSTGWQSETEFIWNFLFVHIAGSVEHGPSTAGGHHTFFYLLMFVLYILCVSWWRAFCYCLTSEFVFIWCCLFCTCYRVGWRLAVNLWFTSQTVFICCCFFNML